METTARIFIFPLNIPNAAPVFWTYVKSMRGVKLPKVSPTDIFSKTNLFYIKSAITNNAAIIILIIVIT